MPPTPCAPPTRRRAVALAAALALTLPALAQPVPPAPADAASAPAGASGQTVVIQGRRASQVGPMPGLVLRLEQIPGNVQSASGEEIKASRATALSDFMNSRLQSVNVNDYQGNPFQVDVQYRGFSASPQLGTPQGLSVFLDGVRVNEPFGDVVNWDLIPLNAIERFDLFPGSNPLFGLNTLGGALSLRTRSGFQAEGFEADVEAGSHGRRQARFTLGGHDGTWAGFGALNLHDDDGWRDASPSRLGTLFGRLDRGGEASQLTATVLLADNRLVGNGMVPIGAWRERAEAVFTAPDETRNRLRQLTLSGLWDLSPTTNVTALAYRREGRRSGFNGDVYEGFEDFAGETDNVRTPPRTGGQPICQFVDADGDGRADRDADGRRLPPLNDPCVVPRTNGTPRNGANSANADGSYPDGLSGAGVVDGTPNGLITRTALQQASDGVSVQFNANPAGHAFMVGASLDRSAASLRNTQRLGVIDAGRQVVADPTGIDGLYRAAQVDIPTTTFDGDSRTASLYFSETWSPRANLHLTMSARWNHTAIRTRVDSRFGVDLHEIRNGNLLAPVILCPTADPASCPDTLAPPWPNDLSQEQVAPTRDRFTYRSLNPMLGLTWLPWPHTTVHASLGRGTRVPSVIELGCAFDDSLIDVNLGREDGNGNPLPPLLRPRSLAGPTCTLPTTLSGDPFLPQIRATTGELGARGRLPWPGVRLEWTASLYRTDLRDDIFFVGVRPDRSFFDTVGRTRRQGFEVGVRGDTGPLEFSVNYGFTDATYQSTFYTYSPRNSSADFDQNSQTGAPLPTPQGDDNGDRGTFLFTRIDPGARMPGVPLHNLNAKLGWRVTPAWRVALGVVAHSRAFVRGNDNNAHVPGGTDQQTGLISGDPLRPQPTPPGRPFTTAGSVPSHAVFQFDTTWQVTPRLSLHAVVTNLFDRRYLTAGRLGIDPFVAGERGARGASGFNFNAAEWQNTTFVGPGAPRGIYLGLTYTLDTP
jgi:iron complex outermembrane recepter protein